MEQGVSLPGGWRWAKIGDIVESMKNGIYKPAKFYDNHGVACLRMYNIEDGAIVWKDIKRMVLTKEEIETYLLNPGDILVNRVNSRELVGKAAIIPDGVEPVIFESKNIRLRIRSDIANSKFVNYCFVAFRQKYFNFNAQQVVGMASINQAQIAQMPIPLPPLPEQERIVAKIEELFSQLDAGTAALRRIQAGLKRYKASVLKAACEGRLVPQDPSDEPAEELLQRLGKSQVLQKFPPQLPNTWCWTRLGDIAEHRLGKMLDKEKNRGEFYPYLRNINVRWFDFDFSDIQFMRVLPNEIENISVKKNDLVVCEGGEPGRAAVWNKDEPMVIQKALHRVRPVEGVMPFYLALCLATNSNTGSLEKYFTGSTIKHLTGESLHSYVFPLPPLAEQRRIVAEVERRLSVVAQVEAAVAAGIARSERLRQAILRRAFEGRLVPQDPSDEPAGLLESARAAAKAKDEPTPKQARLFS